MKTPKENREEVRKNCMMVPMTKVEKDNVRAAAEEMGVTMSAFVRIVLKDFMKKGGLK